jgi:hypothetical protein
VENARRRAAYMATMGPLKSGLGQELTPQQKASELESQVDDLDEEIAGNEAFNPRRVEISQGFGGGGFLERFALAL